MGLNNIRNFQRFLVYQLQNGEIIKFKDKTLFLC